MQPDKFLIGIAIFAFFIGAGLVVVQDNVDTGNIITEEGNHTSGLERLEDSLNGSYSVSKSWSDDLEGGETTVDDAENNLFNSAFLTIKRMRGSFSLIGKSVKIILEEVNMPPIVGDLVLTIVLTLIMAAIIYLIFRFQPR